MEIMTHLNDPHELEKMYRANRVGFRKEFNALYPDFRGNALVECWNARLNYERAGIGWGSGREVMFVLIASIVAGVIAKIPAIFDVSEEFFYPRNIGFILFPPLLAYFAWQNKLSTPKVAFAGGASLLSVIYINWLPNGGQSDTFILACIHLLLFLWCLLGFVYEGDGRNLATKRLDFLKYNGDLAVMCALIVISGIIMTGITIGLFSVIGLDIEKFYFENVVVFGLPSVPILGTYLIRTNPTLVGKVSPVIAKLFSPLVLVMLVIYLGAMVYAGKDPYNDREFLLIFNGLLIGVMAIIFFSIAERSGETKSKSETWVLFLLSVLTVIVNGIALSAILFRISEWGITPNRLAVLGGNVLVLINLLLVVLHLYRALANKTGPVGAIESIAGYLPVYFLWTIVVTFLFPFFFGFS